jgi:ABC-type Fe3+-hydroxamate transport system substrate-binding protein
VIRFVRGFTKRNALLALLALACARRDQREIASDDFGDPLQLGAPAQRIVSLSPTTTEILFALGTGARLVGRTHWDVYPDSARLVPDLGNGMRPNVEAVLAQRPDLVVLYAGHENRDAALALRAAGVNTLSLRIDRLDQLWRAVYLLGLATGKAERAAVVIDTVRATLDSVRRITRGLERPSVFLHAWENPLLTIGAGSYLSELVEIAGGRNVFGDLAAPSPQVSFEEVLRRNPDAVLAGPVTVRQLLQSARWQALPAVRAGRVLVMDTLLAGRPGVRVGEAALSFARLLHPERVR